MVEWEYEEKKLNSNWLKQKSELNEFGKDGWELCAIRTVNESLIGIFKRKVMASITYLVKRCDGTSTLCGKYPNKKIKQSM